MARKAKAVLEPTEIRTETIEQYLARGGRIQQIQSGLRSEDIVYKTGPKSKRGRAATAAKKRK
jgi:hypothetical protein